MPALKDRIRQEHDVARALGSHQGTVWYVDSTGGANGNDGLSPRHPFATLVYALTQAAAGDAIVLAPRGSETVTATVAVSLAGVKIVCPVRNPRSGYTIQGAGTLDLMTVSAADVHLKGLRFAHTGATSNQSCVLPGAGADRCVVEDCLFDDTAITTTFTGVGVEITDACDDALVLNCTSLDCRDGVLLTVATATNQHRPRVEGCTFYVGRAAGFGVRGTHAGTGTVRGPIVKDCLFIEANGDGTAATAAWNGTNGTNATQGPVSLSANCDQYTIVDCRAFTASAVRFSNLNAINAGAAGDVITSESGTGSDPVAAVDSVGTLVSSALSATVSYGVTGSTANSSGLSATVSAGLVVSSALSATVSYGVAGSTANSSGLSATVSYGVAGSTANSSGLSATVSHGVAGSTAHSSGLSATVSAGLVTSSALSATVSYGVAGSTANSSGLSATVSYGVAGSTANSSGLSATVSVGVVGSSTLSAIQSYGTAGSTANSSGLSATVSYGVAGSTANSSGLSATVSYGVAGSTSHSSSLSAIVSVGVVANAARLVFKGGTLLDTALSNNTQVAGNTLCTASGDCWIDELIIEKDGTGFTGPTNVEATVDNAYGDTGVDDPVAVVATATLLAATRIAGTGTAVWATIKFPFVLESGKKLFLHGSDAAGTSGGNIRYAVRGYAMSAGGSLS